MTVEEIYSIIFIDVFLFFINIRPIFINFKFFEEKKEISQKK